MIARFFGIVAILFLLFGGSVANATAQADPLPSWNDGAAKERILTFVAEVTRYGSPRYVPPDERIATFDNDGTLWCEQPMYVQFVFTGDRARVLAAANPELHDKQELNTVLESDPATLAASGETALAALDKAIHAGQPVEEYHAAVKSWLATARHPRFDKPYTRLPYQPQMELLTYLRANEFKTFIVSGGSADFMRPWTDEVYGIPPEQVVGSVFPTKYEIRGT